MLQCFQKKKKFLTPKKWKKCSLKNWHQKLLIISPDPFFPQSSPDHSPQPRIDFPYYEILLPDICSLICVLEPRPFFYNSQKSACLGIIHLRRQHFFGGETIVRVVVVKRYNFSISFFSDSTDLEICENWRTAPGFHVYSVINPINCTDGQRTYAR